uniref:Penicillin-binding protein 2 n=1 Tax=candidate division WOR-3 bacterium TaxID=2052148 RepID=A0A7V3ZY07_UNCW3
MKVRTFFLNIILISVYIFYAVYVFLFQTTPLGSKYRELGTEQSLITLPLQGERGIIYDRNGNPLAVNVPTLEIYKVKPSLTTNTIKSLLKYKSNGAQIFMSKLQNGINHTKVAEFKFRSTLLDEFRKSEEIFQRIVNERYYPYGEVLAPVIGCVGEDENPLGGLELVLDPYIRGKPGKIIFIRDALGNLVALSKNQDIDPERGKSIVTTINLALQEFCYHALKRRIQETGASRGFVIVTNPQTGEILTMAVYPSKNPNEKIPTKNLAIEDPYEPGSTFKLITYASALENKILKLSDTINTENGKFYFYNHLITDEHPSIKLTVREAFAYSSNIAAAKIGIMLGAQKLYRTAQKFGIGCPSGINLPGESAPPILKPSKWGNLRLANFSYGYGVMVNGVQMAMAYGAVANGGLLLLPKIIKDGKPVIIRRAISKELADTLKEMMRDVVLYGTGKKADVYGLEVCGKTGTAKTLDTTTGTYTSNAMISSFIGFFPKDNPKYLIYVVIFEPKGPIYVRYGGEVAAPLFREIANFIAGGKNATVATCLRF